MVALFLGWMLILCSGDVKHNGVMVAWEGVLRVIGGVIIAGFGFHGHYGLTIGLAGLGDLAIGVIYLWCLPRHLGVALIDLLTD